MPVFARLSRRFYEVVGEDVTQQLVDWLNQVEEELTSRARLRQQHELNLLRSTSKRSSPPPITRALDGD
jgi:UDP-N-acetyl-D-mannosaminuronate dehydrogenase